MSARGAGRTAAVTVLLLAGCTLAPKTFRDLVHPAPLVRARAVGLSDGMPTTLVVPALLDRLDDVDLVVRLTAHEELKQRTGHDFGYQPWDSDEDRQQAVERWRGWWSGRSPEPAPSPQH